MANLSFKSTNSMVFGALCVVINIVFGTAVNLLHIPLLFLDTVGTILSAALYGPFMGAAVGGLTNVILGATSNPKEMLFALVNIAIGLIVGSIAKKWGFDIKTAIITGLVLSIVAPLVGTPIAVYVFGGLTGDGNDLLFAWLRASGQGIFTSAFIPRITGNFVDKIASCILVSLVLMRLPKPMTAGHENREKQA